MEPAPNLRQRCAVIELPDCGSKDRHTDKDLLLMIAGLKEGQRFTWMGDEGAKAVRNLWKQGLFGDVQIKADSIVDHNIYLCLYLEEKPRLSKVVFNRKVAK
ncbi:MAG: hypothetical protein ACKOX4_05605, partial [Bacteroidota bacterium]